MKFNNQKNEIETLHQFVQNLDLMKAFLLKLIRQETAVHNAPQDSTEKIREMTDLRMLFKSDHWPKAVGEETISNTEEEKLHSGALLINKLVKTDLFDKNILFFGCKEGHAGFVANQLFGPKKVVCYDIENQNWNHFEKFDNLIFTTNWSDVEANGKYDVIVIDDVIDHSQEFEKSFLKIIANKKDEAKIFIRCHPWCSRNGCHIADQTNKAFLHLVFTEDELFTIGIKPTKTVALLDPIKSYRKLFQVAGLTVMNEKVKKTDVELFFVHNPAILRRIKEKWANSDNLEYASGNKFPREFLEIEYVDFTLI